MNCLRAKRLLPLAAGGDLPLRKTGRLGAHLKKCVACRGELQAYRTALLGMKSLARSEPLPDWPEPEWRRIMKRAIAQSPEKIHQVFAYSNKRLAWTLGSAFVLLLAIGSVLVLRHGRNREYPRLPAPAIVDHSPSQAKTSLPGPAPLSSPELVESSPRPKVEFRRPLGPDKISASQAFQARAPKKQDVVNMVFVSPESGLTIHWVFNSEFEWKEK